MDSIDFYADYHVLRDLTQPFHVRHDPVWDVRCSTGFDNICEMKDFTLTQDHLNLQQSYFPATNLRMVGGWLPNFDHDIARMLRNETKMLIMQSCYLQFFVLREMLNFLILPYNMIEKIELAATDARFQLTWLDLRNNLLTDISFIAPLTDLTYVDLSGNRLEILELKLFQNKLHLGNLILSDNRIKTIEASSVMNFPCLNFIIANNQLTDLNTKQWFSNNMMQINFEGNKFQTINAIELAKSIPKLFFVLYDKNPWNCGRLRSLQSYLEPRLQRGYNLSEFRVASCQDESNINAVAFKLPELLNLAEESLKHFGSTAHKLVEDREEKFKLKEAQFRLWKNERSLEKMTEKLFALEETYYLARKSVELLDFF